MRRASILFAALLCACAEPRPPFAIERPRDEIEPTPQPAADKSNLIRVRTPQPGALAKSPLHITGVARGVWYFEASFPVAIFDEQRRELARHYATAQGEWMTDDFVSFEADLVFAAGSAREGTLVLFKANPSGALDQEDQLAIPVRLAPKRRR